MTLGMMKSSKEANTVTVRLYFDTRDDEELQILEALTSMRLTHRRNSLVKKLIKAGFRATGSTTAPNATARSGGDVDNRPLFLLNVKTAPPRSANYSADLGLELGMQDLESNLYKRAD